MAVAPPRGDPLVSAGNVWEMVDVRIMRAITAALAKWGKARSRVVTMNFPVAGTVAPLPGWIASVGIAHNIKVVGWVINSLIPGQVTIDLKVSSVQASQSTNPNPISILGSHTLSLNGYTVANQDTSAWLTNQISAGSILHVFIISASAVSEAILVLRVIDMDSKTLSQ